jgi:filamentous hemagglutinin family protein
MKLRDRLLLSGAVLCYLMLPAEGLAQITPDDSLGRERSRVTPNVTVRGAAADRIDGGATRGANLYHSFQDFNVNDGQRVYFGNPAGIQNILSRVTGTDVSDILGTLGVDGNANLFLLNPNGIIFGPNARLDISGSFTASTGDRFTFSDGSEFSATNPQAPPLLNVSVPIGLQPGRGNIIHRGNLTTGQTLVLSAGNLNVNGELRSERDLTLIAQDRLQVQANSTLFSGRDMVFRSPVRLLGNAGYTTGGYFITQQSNGRIVDFLNPHPNVIQANGDVVLGDYTGQSLYILGGGEVRLGRVSITETAIGTIERNIADGEGGTQTVRISNSGQPTLDVRSGVDWSSFPEGLPGNTNTSTANPTFNTGANSTDIVGSGVIRVNPSEQGGTVNLNATTGSINMNGIDVSSNTSNNGGRIILSANENISVAGFLSVRSETTNRDAGNGGTILIESNTGDINVNELTGYSTANTSGNSRNGGVLEVASTSGNININVLNFGVYAPSGTTGNGGSVTITTGGDGNIAINGYGWAHAHTDRNNGVAGNGGIIRLTSDAGNIEIGRDGNGGELSVHSIATEDGNTGNGGRIEIRSNTGNISAAALAGYSTAYGVGSVGRDGGILEVISASGNINVDAFNFGVYAPSGRTGNGGSVAIATGGRGTIAISNFGLAHAHTDNGGVAGNGGVIRLTSDAGNIGIGQDGDGGNLSVHSVARRSGDTSDGGRIEIRSNTGAINADRLQSYSAVFGDPNVGGSGVVGSGNTGRGGSITIRSIGGSIVTNNINSSSYAPLGNTDSGGVVTIETLGGNIRVASIDTISQAGSGNAGDGGNIYLESNLGDISISDRLFTFSFSEAEGDAGNAGDITLDAQNINGGNGNTNARLSAFAVVPGESTQAGLEAGNGGDVRINVDNSVRNLNISTLSSNNESGSVSIAGSGNLRLQDISLIASAQAQIPSIFNEVVYLATGFSDTNSPAKTDNVTVISISNQSTTNVPVFGPPGNVVINSEGNLDFSNVEILSDANGESNAGDISVTSLRRTTFRNGSEINSTTNSDGDAGTINITTGLGLVLETESQISASTNARGAGGNITIESDRITLSDNSSITAGTSGQASAGSISLEPNDSSNLSINLRDRSTISASTSSTGAGGNIEITAPEAITIRGNGQLSAAATGTGSGGNIEIAGGSFSLLNNARLTTSSTDPASAPGNIFVQSRDNIRIRGGTVSSTGMNNEGSGFGIIELESLEGSVFLDNADLNTSNTGSEFAGDIFINAPNQIVITNESNISSDGNFGRLFVDTSSVVIQDSWLSTTNRGASDFDSGDIDFTVSESIQITNSRISSNTVGAGTGGSIRVSSDRITLSSNSSITAETLGQAPAGSISLQPNDSSNLLVNLSDESTISASTSGAGVGGDIEVTAPETITIQGNGSLSAETSGTGEGGDIAMRSPGITILNGVEISASTEGQGRGGRIFVDAPDFVRLVASELSSEASGQGWAGDLTVNAGQLRVEERARLSVSSPDGQAGDLAITADAVILNDGTLTAEAGQGDGGNITVTVSGPLLRLINENQEELISARAVNGANGGRITLNVENGFVVANPNDNSDVVASAIQGGRGGSIEINALGIFGLEERNPRNRLTSDLNASSDVGIDGTIELNTLGIDPTRGLAELPETVEPPNQVARGCGTGGETVATQQGSFVVTGRGGLPPNPGDVLNSEPVGDDWVALDETVQTQAVSVPPAPGSQPLTEIVEAQGWVINDKGEVEAAIEPSSTPQNAAIATPTCAVTNPS